MTKQVDAACPKCGDREGFRDAKPSYRALYSFVPALTEWLHWECTTCGYVIVTPTADHSRLDEPSPATRHRQQPAPGSAVRTD